MYVLRRQYINYDKGILIMIFGKLNKCNFCIKNCNICYKTLNNQRTTFAMNNLTVFKGTNCQKNQDEYFAFLTY